MRGAMWVIASTAGRGWAFWPGRIHHRSVAERTWRVCNDSCARVRGGGGRGKSTPCRPRDPAAPAASRWRFVALTLILSGLGSAFIPSSDRVALAKNGVAVSETLILAGPGGDFGILTAVPAGAELSVDGDPVDGYYPVTYQGISGWAAIGLIQVGNDDGGGNGGGGGDGNRNRDQGNGGVETVTADPGLLRQRRAGRGSTAERSRPPPASRSPSRYPAARTVPAAAATASSRSSTSSTRRPTTTANRVSAMLRVARCESGLNPSAVGGGGAYHGLFQFVPSTFCRHPLRRIRHLRPLGQRQRRGLDVGRREEEQLGLPMTRVKGRKSKVESSPSLHPSLGECRARGRLRPNTYTLGGILAASRPNKPASRRRGAHMMPRVRLHPGERHRAVRRWG